MWSQKLGTSSDGIIAVTILGYEILRSLDLLCEKNVDEVRIAMQTGSSGDSSVREESAHKVSDENRLFGDLS